MDTMKQEIRQAASPTIAVRGPGQTVGQTGDRFVAAGLGVASWNRLRTGVGLLVDSR